MRRGAQQGQAKAPVRCVGVWIFLAKKREMALLKLRCSAPFFWLKISISNMAHLHKDFGFLAFQIVFAD
ncbi:MAG: hypothetical protein AAF744_01155 [Pseudomonadota bacterium]